MVLTPGQIIGGRFHLVRRAGQGATGAVWLAHDQELEGSPVALKVLRRGLALSPQAVSSLKREVLLARRLRHPNIIAVYTFWAIDSLCFISMEYVEGRTLTNALGNRDQPFTLGDVLPWIVQLADGLDYAHGEGILHRDIKPSNILLDEQGRVRLVDFGIARTAQEARQLGADTRTSGTILFMSPEQLRGEGLDHRSDQYSLASTVYELLAGRPPFHGGDIVSQVLQRQPTPIALAPDTVNDVLMRGLAKSRGDRFESCGAFSTALIDAVQSAGIAMQDETLLKYVGGPPSRHDAPTVELPASDVALQYLRLGEQLIESGIVSSAQCADALAQQRLSGERLGRLLVEKGALTEQGLAEALSSQLRLPLVRAEALIPDAGLLALIDRAWAESHLCLPLARERYRIVAAMADPLDLSAINDLEMRAGLHVEPSVALESELREAIRAAFS